MLPTIKPSKLVSKTAIVFLHGLGDSGSNLKQFFQPLFNEKYDFIFPTAKIMDLPLISEFPVHSWFHIKSLDSLNTETPNDIYAESSKIKDLIDSHREQNPLSKILLAGFSQGAALALYTALTQPLKIDSVCAIEGWLPKSNEGDLLRTVNEIRRVHFIHSEMDSVVPIDLGKEAFSNMTKMGFNTTKDIVKTGDHGISDEIVSHFTRFVESMD